MLGLLSLAISVFYIIATIKILGKANATVAQIIVAIIIPPYGMYLFGIIANKKALGIALAVLSVISMIIAGIFLTSFFDALRANIFSMQSIQQGNLTSEAYEQLLRERESAMMNDIIGSFAIYYLIMGIINIISTILRMIVMFFMGKSFGKSNGFCWGLTFLPFIFLPIMAFDDSTCGYY